MRQTVAMLHEDINEVTEAEGATFYLPKRKLKIVKVVGLIMMVVSAIPLFIGYQFVVEPFQDFMEKDDYFSLIFAIVGLVPAIIGLLLFLAGFGLLFSSSRSRISIDYYHIKTREYFGLFYKTWTFDRNDIVSIAIETANQGSRSGSQPIKTQDMNLWAITCQKKGNEKGPILAPGYDRALLESLAERLRDELAVPIVDAPSTPFSAEPASENNTTSEAKILTQEVPEQPSGSKIVFEEQADGIAIRVPPAGVIKGSKGLFFFALFWNIFVICMVGGLGYAALTGDDEAWFGLLFMLIFVAVGVGTMLGALNMGRRSADILLMRSDTLIKRRGIFGEKVSEILTPDLTEICIGPSGLEVNGRPVHELQFHTSSGKAIGLLSQLKDEEIRWLAALLQNKLVQLK